MQWHKLGPNNNIGIIDLSVYDVRCIATSGAEHITIICIHSACEVSKAALYYTALIASNTQLVLIY